MRSKNLIEILRKNPAIKCVCISRLDRNATRRAFAKDRHSTLTYIDRHILTQYLDPG